MSTSSSSFPQIALKPLPMSNSFVSNTFVQRSYPTHPIDGSDSYVGQKRISFSNRGYSLYFFFYIYSSKTTVF